MATASRTRIPLGTGFGTSKLQARADVHLPSMSTRHDHDRNRRSGLVESCSPLCRFKQRIGQDKIVQDAYLIVRHIELHVADGVVSPTRL